MTKLIIFDMDGTLVDSWPGMQYCYNQTFKEYGREDTMLHIDGDELERAVRIFREHYRDRGHALSTPFPGMLDLVRQLHSEGFRLGIATMILQQYAVDILDELKIRDCFDVIEGSDITGERSKADMIRNCMVKTGVSNDNTVMIGDGFNDQKAAEKSKVGFIAAAYGYGITVQNCEEYNIECAPRPEDVRKAIDAHWTV